MAESPLTVLVSLPMGWPAPLPPALAALIRLWDPLAPLALHILTPTETTMQLRLDLERALRGQPHLIPWTRHLCPEHGLWDVDQAQAPTAHLWTWLQGVALVEDGQRFVCLQGDTHLSRPLAALWLEARPPRFTWAMPGQGSCWAPSLLAGIKTRGTEGFLAEWTRETDRMTRRDAEWKRNIVHQYGSIQGAAWALAMSRSEEGGGPVIARLPLETWGQVASA
jgi:hypothetical protein